VAMRLNLDTSLAESRQEQKQRPVALTHVG
jgi:hypothetical protein